MHKKEFELFAKMFKESRFLLERPPSEHTWNILVDDFCKVCCTINDKFDEGKFKRACDFYCGKPKDT